jgi:meso-butanediol dehydrogenase / (S,S)-butanediol dehydrogenase / diacetyl reductase
MATSTKESEAGSAVGGRVAGKVAIVTGGASGIGEGMVRALHAEGAQIVVADISGNEEQVAGELGERAIAVNTDVTDDAAVAEMVKSAVEEFGQLDVLCNNAGIDGEMAPTAECTLENFDRVMSVNTRAVFLGLRHAIPAMIEGGGGSIVNTASIAGLVGFQGMPAYCTSKAAVLGLTRSVALEYAAAGIRCNAICPGVIKTALLEGLEKKEPELFAELLGSTEERTALGRLGAPSEIGAATVFLASDESSFLTGVALPVDGGYTAG